MPIARSSALPAGRRAPGLRSHTLQGTSPLRAGPGARARSACPNTVKRTLYVGDVSIRTTDAPSSFNQHIFFSGLGLYGTADGYQDGS